MSATWDITNIITTYQDNIDRLIDQLGKPVMLFFHPVKTNLTDDNYSVIHGDKKLPEFKANSVVETRSSVQIKALIKWNPKEVNKYNINFKEGKAIIRLKTMLTDVPNLTRCEYIIPNYESVGIISNRFKLIMMPIPVGLGEDRYAISFWEEV